jgi:hypothetical protein
VFPLRRLLTTRRDYGGGILTRLHKREEKHVDLSHFGSQNHWVCSFVRSPEFEITRKTTFRIVDLFPSWDEWRDAPILSGPFESDQWFFSFFRLFRIPTWHSGQWSKPTNPPILSVIRHRKILLDPTLDLPLKIYIHTGFMNQDVQTLCTSVTLGNNSILRS